MWYIYSICDRVLRFLHLHADGREAVDSLHAVLRLLSSYQAASGSVAALAIILRF